MHLHEIVALWRTNSAQWLSKYNEQIPPAAASQAPQSPPLTATFSPTLSSGFAASLMTLYWSVHHYLMKMVGDLAAPGATPIAVLCCAKDIDNPMACSLFHYKSKSWNTAKRCAWKYIANWRYYTGCFCVHMRVHTERAGKPSMSLTSAKARVVCA